MQTHGSARLKRFMRFDTKALLIFKRISDILASLSHDVNAIVKFFTHAITHWVWRPVDDDYSASRRRCVLGQPGHRMPPRYGLSNDRRCCIAAFSQRVSVRSYLSFVSPLKSSLWAATHVALSKLDGQKARSCFGPNWGDGSGGCW